MPQHQILKRSSASFVVLAIGSALWLAGCNGAGGKALHIKSSAAGEKDVSVKSAYAFAVTKTFTDATGKMTTAVDYNVFVANYDLDSSFFAQTINKPMASDDQVRVTFSLVGDEGGNEKTAPKAGTYSAAADKFMKVESVGIVTRKGSAEDKGWWDRSSTKGEVKITSASADSISGDVDLSGGANSIRGSFTAKVLTRK